MPDADLTRKRMACYREKKRFVQTACFGLPGVCVQTGYILYNDRYERAEQMWREREK